MNYRIKAEQSLTLLDGQLVGLVAEKCDYTALRRLFKRWLDPQPTDKQLDAMPFEQASALGHDLMAMVASKARQAESLVEAKIKKGRVH